MSTSAHPATLDEDALLGQCTTATSRRSGPGGQHRNKVETAVIITHKPTGIQAEANERRSQDANRREAIARLRVRLALEFRTSAGAVSELWQQRTSGGRISVSPNHRDFAILLAEAINHLAEAEFDTTAAATKLLVSPTQLVKLLRQHPPAFTMLNQQRKLRGLHPLR